MSNKTRAAIKKKNLQAFGRNISSLVSRQKKQTLPSRQKKFPWKVHKHLLRSCLIFLLKLGHSTGSLWAAWSSQGTSGRAVAPACPLLPTSLQLQQQSFSKLPLPPLASARIPIPGHCVAQGTQGEPRAAWEHSEAVGGGTHLGMWCSGMPSWVCTAAVGMGRAIWWGALGLLWCSLWACDPQPLRS